MKPGDFFIGVQDFFSILLPGAGLAFIANSWARQLEIPDDHVLHALLDLHSAGAWAAFLVISYVLGHIVASTGAKFDMLYDRRKDDKRNHALTQIVDTHLESFIKDITANSPRGRRLSAPKPAWPLRVMNVLFLWCTWGKDKDQDAHNEKPINAYKLARITLHSRAPSVFNEVARLEADSKFFRSLAVVAVFAVFACAVQLIHDVWLSSQHAATWERPVWGVAYFVFVLLVLRSAFSRFCELRLKATETAFQAMIVIDKLGAAAVDRDPDMAKD